MLNIFEVTYMLLMRGGKFDSSTMTRAILYDNKISIHEYYEVYRGNDNREYYLATYYLETILS